MSSKGCKATTIRKERRMEAALFVGFSVYGCRK